MTEQKMTYKNALTNAINEVTNAETKARLEDLLVSLEKKAQAKKKSVDNSAMEADIENALKSNGVMTPTELVNVINAPNTQKVSAVVGKMASVRVNKNGKKVTYEFVG